MTTLYPPLMDSPAAGTAILDGLTGQIAFLAGLDRPEAVAAFNLYQANTTRSGAAFDSAQLRVVFPGGFIQFAWETNIAIGQDYLWTTVWQHLAIENRLYPSRMLVEVFEAIVRLQRVADEIVVAIAPTIAQAPSISPASGPVGTTFTITPAIVTGTDPIERAGTLAVEGVVVEQRTDGAAFTFTSTSTGTLQWSETATNSAGSASASASATAAVAAPTITQQATISPDNGLVGSTFTVTPATVEGTEPITRAGMLTQGGQVVATRTNGAPFTFATQVAGQLAWSETATNAGGSVSASASAAVAGILPQLSVQNFAFWDASMLPLGAAPASWLASQADGFGIGMAWDRAGTVMVESDPNGRRWLNFDSGAYFRDGQQFPAGMAMSVWTMMRPANNITPVLYNGPVQNASETNRITFGRQNMDVRVAGRNVAWGSVASTGTGPLSYQWSRPENGTILSLLAWQENEQKTFSFSQTGALSLDAPRFVWGGSPNTSGVISGVSGLRASALLVTFGQELSAADRNALHTWSLQRRAAL